MLILGEEPRVDREWFTSEARLDDWRPSWAVLVRAIRPNERVPAPLWGSLPLW